jgi:hypothetical protein
VAATATATATASAQPEQRTANSEQRRTTAGRNSHPTTHRPIFGDPLSRKRLSDRILCFPRLETVLVRLGCLDGRWCWYVALCSSPFLANSPIALYAFLTLGCLAPLQERQAQDCHHRSALSDCALSNHEPSHRVPQIARGIFIIIISLVMGNLWMANGLVAALRSAAAR